MCLSFRIRRRLKNVILLFQFSLFRSMKQEVCFKKESEEISLFTKFIFHMKIMKKSLCFSVSLSDVIGRGSTTKRWRSALDFCI